MGVQKGNSMNDTLKEGSIDRRGLLKCMSWVGTGLIWTLSGGVPRSRLLGAPLKEGVAADFSFVQVSDSHIGFSKPANPDVTGTLQAAVNKINSLPVRPE